jgi:CRISPR-associated endonuclease/helicase Cas3
MTRLQNSLEGRMSKPYPYQSLVAEKLLSGKNVILQAPTGAGKTRAAILPLLNSFENSRMYFPHKCIYAVPMRVLATQFVTEYQPLITERAVNLNAQEKIHNQRGADKSFVDIQTGDQRGDPAFESAVTFATIDQVLSSFLCAPYSLPTRQANLNAGAIAASYLIFDEFHLFDPTSTLPTTLEMLRILRHVSPFLLMTATFSRTMLERLADLLKAEVVGNTEIEQAEFAALPSQQKIRRYHAIDAPLTAEQVLNRHERRSIAVCNKVERAQALFESIRIQAPHDVEVLLLHSRFLPKDRASIERKIQEKLSKVSNREANLIVVSTQAIEVGLDINCTVLHTELAPANSIIQRAGRCARYQGAEGDVLVYRRAREYDGSEVDLIEEIMPYKNQQEAIRLTWEAFSTNHGVLDYAGEQAVLNHAHQTQDAEVCERLQSRRLQHREDVFSVMAGDRGQVARLVRDIHSQRVIIHDDPNRLLDELEQARLSPYSVKGFNLEPGTLQGYAKDWLLDRVLDDEPPFRVMYLDAQPDPEQNSQPVYKWESVSDPKSLLGAPLIVVHSTLAGYDTALGFLPRKGSERPLPSWLPSANEVPSDIDRSYDYRLETYEKHIERVYDQFQHSVWEELTYAATKLERRYKWPEGSVWQAARLTVLLHDTGKLNIEWQKWVVEWQKNIGLEGSVVEGEAYGHTDNYTPEHWQKSKTFGRKRPPHAVEGAVAATLILADQLGDIPELLKAAFTAIARHHAPDSSTFEPFRLENGAIERTRRVLLRHAPEMKLGNIAFPNLSTQKGFSTKDGLISPTPNEEAAYLAYILLARALRRADQRGTAAGTQKE